MFEEKYENKKAMYATFVSSVEKMDYNANKLKIVYIISCSMLYNRKCKFKVLFQSW